MRAKPVRMLLLPGLVFLLVVGAGWSLAQAHGKKKTPAHRTVLRQPQRQRLTPRPARALEDGDSDQVATTGRTNHRAKPARPAGPAKPAKRARAASSAVTVTTHPPASVNLSAGWRSVPDPSNLG